MAIVWTLDRLRQFLLGIKFTIVTDCQALVYMNSRKTTNTQIARWCDLIQEYDFTVQHRSGGKMVHVDALSWALMLESEDTLTELIEKGLEICLT
ncbi:retrovirus-related Pol polyprotein from transposon 17.6 [Trichonephila clavipes]|nr:retrovirus-related Pol polyprotein from transposon 17.6 [Trichonephila clavipes]